MAAVANLCGKVMFLDQGRIRSYVSADVGISEYMATTAGTVAGDVDLSHHPNRRRNTLPLLQRVRLLNSNQTPTSLFNSGDPLHIELTVAPGDILENPQFGIGVDSNLGVRIFSLITQVLPIPLPRIQETCTASCQIDELPLAPGQYTLSLSAGVHSESLLDAIDHAVTFNVEAGDFFGSGKVTRQGHGNVLVRAQWKIQS